MAESNGLKKYLVTIATAITTAIIVQSSTLLYWGGTMSARMDGAEKDIEHVQVRVTYLEQK